MHALVPGLLDRPASPSAPHPMQARRQGLDLYEVPCVAFGHREDDQQQVHPGKGRAMRAALLVRPPLPTTGAACGSVCGKGHRSVRYVCAERALCNHCATCIENVHYR